MPLVSDQYHLVAGLAVPCDFEMHLGDQWAGCVEYCQAAFVGFLANLLRYPVGTEDHGAAVGDLAQFVDEHCAAFTQALHHEAVVHDLVAHVDRRAEGIERALDDLDRAVDAAQKPRGLARSIFIQDCRARPRLSSVVRITHAGRQGSAAAGATLTIST